MGDVWGDVGSTFARAPAGAVWVVDRRVEALHGVSRFIREPRAVVMLQAGERAKSMSALDAVADASLTLPRSGTLICVGGGTLGDLSTVAAHLIKRGVRLVQVPTTLLAAVDSSVGGKGALNVGAVKNALGVFHEADEWWLCPQFFSTLSTAQKREGQVEAMKMAVCLDAKVWRRWSATAPDETELVKTARRLKRAVCAKDPFEQSGVRAVLNFGHTFGHCVESLTKYRVRHGEAVELGMLCALDVGRAMRRTPEKVATEVEAALDARGRARLAAAFDGASADDVARLLKSDKKGDGRTVKMVLLTGIAKTTLEPVEAKVWRALWPKWQRGVRP